MDKEHIEKKLSEVRTLLMKAHSILFTLDSYIKADINEERGTRWEDLVL